MDKLYRIATKLELKHYQDLTKPVAAYLARHKPPSGELPAEMKSVAEKIKCEIIRFGYIPTRSGLFIEVRDPYEDSPVLTPEQEAATVKDLCDLWERVWSRNK